MYEYGEPCKIKNAVYNASTNNHMVPGFLFSSSALSENDNVPSENTSYAFHALVRKIHLRKDRNKNWRINVARAFDELLIIIGS